MAVTFVALLSYYLSAQGGMCTLRLMPLEAMYVLSTVNGDREEMV
jgi:hypothetical protein